MSERPRKRTERAIARRIGGRRVPVSGRARGDAPDVQHEIYFIEVKHRHMLPTWLRSAMAQACAAQRDGQVPVVVLHETGSRHEDDLVVLRLCDFEQWHGRLHRDPEGGA